MRPSDSVAVAWTHGTAAHALEVPGPRKTSVSLASEDAGLAQLSPWEDTYSPTRSSRRQLAVLSSLGLGILSGFLMEHAV